MTPRAQRTVIGQVGDLAHARNLYLALQNGGTDQADIRLGGASARAAQEQTEQSDAQEIVDGRVVEHVAGRAVSGALVGTLIGVVAGAVVGALAVLVADVDEWLAIGIAVAVLGMIGGVLGAFVSAERGMGVDDDIELSLTDVSGPVWVAVRVRDDDAARAVSSIFTDNGVSLVEEQEVRANGVHLVEW